MYGVYTEYRRQYAAPLLWPVVLKSYVKFKPHLAGTSVFAGTDDVTYTVASPTVLRTFGLGPTLVHRSVDLRTANYKFHFTNKTHLVIAAKSAHDFTDRTILCLS